MTAVLAASRAARMFGVHLKGHTALGACKIDDHPPAPSLDIRQQRIGRILGMKRRFGVSLVWTTCYGVCQGMARSAVFARFGGLD